MDHCAEPPCQAESQGSCMEAGRHKSGRLDEGGRMRSASDGKLPASEADSRGEVIRSPLLKVFGSSIFELRNSVFFSNFALLNLRKINNEQSPPPVRGRARVGVVGSRHKGCISKALPLGEPPHLRPSLRLREKGERRCADWLVILSREREEVHRERVPAKGAAVHTLPLCRESRFLLHAIPEHTADLTAISDKRHPATALP